MCVYKSGLAEYGGIVLLEEIKPNVETPVRFEFAFNLLSPEVSFERVARDTGPLGDVITWGNVICFIVSNHSAGVTPRRLSFGYITLEFWD